MSRMRFPPLFVALLAIGWLALLTPAAAQTTSDDLAFPALTGRVVDQAGLLSPETETALTQRLEILERDTTDQVVVVTLNSLQGQEIEEYGYRLGRHWAIGQEKDNGLLLIVAPEERKVRIEVGYGLEPIMTDAMSTLIIHNRILPAFREGRFEQGIVQGVDAIEQQLRLDPAEAQARAAAAAAPKPDVPIGPLLIVGVVLFLFFIGTIGGLARGGRRHRGGVSPILIWAASEALRNSGRGGGSSWGGGGFGGGGFSGGGGSFGGGGASGGW